MKTDKKKILIADGDKSFVQAIKRHKSAARFHIETTSKGSECLKKIDRMQPDLVIVDLMLPEVHGIEILKTIKNGSLSSKIGVVITCYHGMIQNYHSAVKFGATYFLEKPVSPTHLFELCHRFFEGTLHPDPFPERRDPLPPKPTARNEESIPSYLKLWGTRGSNPVAGSNYVRFGGNTSCLEVRHGSDLVIIDTGSGTRGLGQLLHDHPDNRFNLVLSHTHWDHLLGFPFFYPIYQPDREIHIWTPIGFEKSTRDLFSDMLAYAYFPVSLDDIQSKLLFKDLRDGQTLQFGGIKIKTHYAFHPGSTLCFKIEIGSKKIGYVTDNEFLMGCHLPPAVAEKKKELFTPYESQIEFLSDCDLLLHEAQYLPEEYVHRTGWGHSSVSNASLLIKKAGITNWIVIHHDPGHTDEILLDKLQVHLEVMKELDYKCLIQLGYDGMMIPIH